VSREIVELIAADQEHFSHNQNKVSILRAFDTQAGVQDTSLPVAPNKVALSFSLNARLQSTYATCTNCMYRY
jgi:hypothetical protein